jgi:hypothetical protein
MTHAHGRRSPRHPDEDELVQAVDASAALRRLLAAAAAPPSAVELKGRSRAVADFRAAQLSRSPGAKFGTAPDTAAAQNRGGLDRGSQDRDDHRATAGFTLVCTAVLVLLVGTAANAAAGELPTTVRNAVAGVLTDLSSDHPPSSGGSSSEHPLQRRPG